MQVEGENPVTPPPPWATMPSDDADPHQAYLARYARSRSKPTFVSDVVERTLAHVAALAASPGWISHVRPAVRRALLTATAAEPAIEEVVCYCLGDLASAAVTYQLAFFLLVANELQVPPARRIVYDPVHLAQDRDALRRCGCTPVAPRDADVGAARRVRCRTLFYMPFAPYMLTDNVVRANWTQLHQVAIMGNSFDWVSSNPFRRARRAAKDDDHDKDDAEEEEDGEGGEIDVAAWDNRAPCVARCDTVRLEEHLWSGDFRTWLTGGEEEEGGEEGEEEGEEDEGEDQEADQESDARRVHRRSLDCTLVRFPPRSLWAAARQGLHWSDSRVREAMEQVAAQQTQQQQVQQQWKQAWEDMAAWPDSPPTPSVVLRSRL
eukprot:g4602.t1